MEVGRSAADHRHRDLFNAGGAATDGRTDTGLPIGDRHRRDGLHLSIGEFAANNDSVAAGTADLHLQDGARLPKAIPVISSKPCWVQVPDQMSGDVPTPNWIPRGRRAVALSKRMHCAQTMTGRD